MVSVVIVGISIYVLGLNMNERAIVNNIIKKRLLRNGNNM